MSPKEGVISQERSADAPSIHHRGVTSDLCSFPQERQEWARPIWFFDCLLKVFSLVPVSLMLTVICILNSKCFFFPFFFPSHLSSLAALLIVHCVWGWTRANPWSRNGRKHLSGIKSLPSLTVAPLPVTALPDLKDQGLSPHERHFRSFQAC